MIFVKHDLHASFRRQMRANQELAIAELRNSSAVRQQSDREERAIRSIRVPAFAGKTQAVFERLQTWLRDLAAGSARGLP